MLRQTLPIAHQMGIDPALITCDVDNIGSRATVRSSITAACSRTSCVLAKSASGFRQDDLSVSTAANASLARVLCVVAALKGVPDCAIRTMTGARGSGMVRADKFKELSPMFGPNFPILGRLLPAPAPVLPVEDDPATLARLTAVMSDHVRPCPNCGGDPYVCRAIGCDADDAPLLLAQPTVDRSKGLDEDLALVDELIAAKESELLVRV